MRSKALIAGHWDTERAAILVLAGCLQHSRYVISASSTFMNTGDSVIIGFAGCELVQQS
jgi:hypothetical protein